MPRAYKKRNTTSRRSRYGKKTKARRRLAFTKKRSTGSKLVKTARRAAKNPSGNPPLVSYKRLLKPKVLTKMTYCDTKTIGPGSSMVNHQFMINSIFDPDYTGIGHQPAFHDEWQTIYSHYRVMAAKVTVKFRPNLTDANVAAQKQTHTGVADAYPYILPQSQRNRVIHFMELNQTTTFPYTEAVDLNCLREGLYPSDTVKWSEGPSSTLSWNIDIRKHLFETSNFENPGAMGSNPTDAVYLAVGAMSRDGGPTNDVQFDIKIDFMVELSNNQINIGSS